MGHPHHFLTLPLNSTQLMSVALQHVPTLNGLNGASTDSKRAKSRNQLRRQKAKLKKATTQAATPDVSTKKEDDIQQIENVEYVSEQLDLKGAASEAFSDVFARFQFESEDSTVKSEDPPKGEVIYSDDEMAGETDSEDEAEKKPLSKKKQRKLNRLTVAELKQLVAKPEVVEWTDVSAADPRLLLHLKCYRNTIPIPAHWSAKRDYLQGKRGIEKPPFQLPSYIADTGIATQRDAIKEKEANMSLKAKTRERVQPKMGKIDIDYQKLHDAFFKFQTKPPLTSFGEMYYEGKEFETSLKEKRPGDLSPELVEALSIPPLAPPPWLISMQRFGPPPSYPTLRIPGLNAPIPEGAQWGFHPGGWGKPPLDEYNRPLYGDVFGVLPKTNDTAMGEPVDKNLWGELEPEEDEEDEESDEEDEEEEEEATDAAPADGLQTPSGLATPSGMASVVSTVAAGLETPDFLELRKTSTVPVRDEGGNRQLYSVLPEKQTGVRGLMGSERGYDVGGVVGASVPVLGEERGNKRKAGGVDVSLDLNELEGLSEEELRKRYDAQERGSAGVPGQGPGREDFSDMVAKEMAKKRQKMEADRDRDRGKRDKGGRDFKF
jgi:splicing factor 3B subunit 2